MEPFLKDSQARIRKTFLELIMRKPIENITVKDICTYAGVSRPLFYSHYDGKYELQEEIEKRLINGFLALMLEIRSVGKIQFYACLNRHDSMYFRKYFDYIKENHEEFYPLLCSNYSNGFSNHFARAIMNTRLETRKAWGIDVSPEPKELALREDILSSLYVSLFSSWLKSNMEISEEKMSQLLISLWEPIKKFE